MSGSRRAEVVWDPETGGTLTLATSEVVIGTPVVEGGQEPDASSPRGRVTAEELFAGAQATCFSLAFGAAMGTEGHLAPAFRVAVESAAGPDVPVLPPAATRVVLELGPSDGAEDRGDVDRAIATARSACGLRVGDRVFVRRGDREREVASQDALPNDARG